MKLKVIYEPKGRAGEYSKYALNLYKSYDFGCLYCFGPSILRKPKELYHTVMEERENLLSKVESDCKKLEGLKEKVLLSFVCDPYNSIDAETELVRKVLELFKTYSINFQILTKGGSRAKRDFDLYKDGDAFASTLTFLDDDKSIYWEPNAALPSDRIATLKEAHSRGIETWVSLEPVIEPLESLKIIEETHEFVDLYKVGTLNYHELSKTIDWKDFGVKAIELLEKYNKNYYIKNDLREYLERE